MNISSGYITFWICLALLTVLVLKRGVVPPNTLRQYVAVFNDRGGNILILTIFSLIFFQSAMAFIYHVIALANTVGNSVDKAQAVITSALGFVTGSTFGGAFGALLKTMNPQTERSMLQRSDTVRTLDPSAPSAPPAAESK